MKIGTTWKTDNHTVYKNDGSGILKECENGPFSLQYKITDIKKSNVKQFYIVAFQVNWNYESKDAVEYVTAIYDKKNKTFTVFERALAVAKLGIANISILENKKLRVKFLDEEFYAYVVDLHKIKKN